MVHYWSRDKETERWGRKKANQWTHRPSVVPGGARTECSEQKPPWAMRQRGPAVFQQQGPPLPSGGSPRPRALALTRMHFLATLTQSMTDGSRSDTCPFWAETAKKASEPPSAILPSFQIQCDLHSIPVSPHPSAFSYFCLFNMGSIIVTIPL